METNRGIKILAFIFGFLLFIAIISIIALFTSSFIPLYTGGAIVLAALVIIAVWRFWRYKYAILAILVLLSCLVTITGLGLGVGLATGHIPLKLKSFEIVGDAKVGGKVIIDKGVEVKNDFNVDGNVIVEEGVQVKKDVKVDGNVIVEEGVQVKKDVKVDGNVIVEEGVQVKKDVKVDGNVIVEEGVQVKKDVKVDGNVIVEEGVQVKKDVKVDGNVIVKEDVHVKGDVNVDGDVNIGGVVNIDGDCIECPKKPSCPDPIVPKTPDAPVIPVIINSTSIKIIPDEIEGKVGATGKLTADVLPTNTTDKTVVWKTSNANVVVVSTNGSYTLKGVGSAIVIATNGANSGICVVSVTKDIITSTSITIVPDKLNIKVGATGKLTANVLPTNTTDKTVVWKTSNANVIDVYSDGSYKATGEGSAIITGTNGANSGICVVSVTKDIITSTSITIVPDKLNIKVGATGKLTANVLPTNTTDKTVVWKTSNANVIDVYSDGSYKATGEGSAIITGTNGANSGICVVSVTKDIITSTSITIVPDKLNIKVGATGKLTANVLPTNTTDKTVAWKTSNANVIDVYSDGSYKATGEGSAIITGTNGANSGICVVSVTKDIITSTSIKVVPEELNIKVGATGKLTANVLPTNTTDKTVAWKTSNANVIDVYSDGSYKATGEGSAIITGTNGANSGICVVSVTKDIITSTSITVVPEELNIKVGATGKLTAEVLPTNTTDKTVVWKTSNANVIDVYSDGSYKATGEGSAIITGTNGANSGICVVSVTKDIITSTSIKVVPEELNIKVGATGKLTAEVLPTNTTDKTVVWKTSNANVIDVYSDGSYKATGEGSAIITGTNGANSDTCVVTVTLKEAEVNVSVTSVNFSEHVDGSTLVYMTVKISESGRLPIFKTDLSSEVVESSKSLTYNGATYNGTTFYQINRLSDTVYHVCVSIPGGQHGAFALEISGNGIKTAEVPVAF